MAAGRPPQATVTALLLGSLASAGSLLVGADYISILLPGGLPFGNLLAASVFCGLAGAAALLAPRRGVSRPAALVSLVASAAWLPLSIAFAGNPSLNFSGQRGTVWLWSSTGLLAFVLGVLLLAAGSAYRSARQP